MSQNIDLGAVSAYALAVKHGYTGSEAEWVAATNSARQAAESAKNTAVEFAGYAQGYASNLEAAKAYVDGVKTAIDELYEDTIQPAATTASTKAEEASGSSTAAQTAQQKSETAQGKAESAQRKAETAQGKAETAQGKAEEAQEAAETAATNLSSSTAQIETNKNDISQVKEDLAEQKKLNREQEIAITNLKASANGITYLEQTDSTAGAAKTVPARALPYASLDMIGGMSRKGRNLIPFPYKNSAFTYKGVSFTVQPDSGIKVVGSAEENVSLIIGDKMYLPAGTYRVIAYGIPSGINSQIVAKKNNSWSTAYNHNKPTFTMEDGDFVNMLVVVNAGTTIDTTVYPMIVSGDTAYPFEPYTADLIDAKVDKVVVSKSDGTQIMQKAIPASVIAACPDYGIGVSANCYNYIDWNEKKYHKRVGILTVSSMTGTAANSDGSVMAYKDIDDVRISKKVKCLSNRFVCDESITYDTRASLKCGYIFSENINTQTTFFFGYAAGSTLSSINAELSESPITVYYELGEEEIVDLSSLIPDDFDIIPVEAGGTVTMHYPCIDTYDVDVPSSITYDVKVEV